jgi:tetratricopeptide (TPR) repeat protein
MFYSPRQSLIPRLLLGAWLLLANTIAQDASARPPEAEESGPGSALVDEAIKLRRQGRDADALLVLEQAAHDNPESMRVRVHLATCYQAVGDWLSAYAQLDEALQHPEDAYVSRHRDTLDAAAQTIGDHLGMLEVGGSPAGASVLLNGQKVGVVPMAAPIRVTIGSYVLEVEMQKHYSTSRPVTIKKGTLTRESVQLRAVSPHTLAGSEAAVPGSSPSDDGSQNWPSAREGKPYAPKWVTWTLAGASGAAAVTGIAALIIRNQNANHWNDDSHCLGNTGVTREQLCANKREAAETAERVALAGGVSALILGAGALVSGLWKDKPSDFSTSQGWLQNCSLTVGGASCRGSF